MEVPSCSSSSLLRRERRAFEGATLHHNPGGCDPPSSGGQEPPGPSPPPPPLDAAAAILRRASPEEPQLHRRGQETEMAMAMVRSDGVSTCAAAAAEEKEEEKKEKGGGFLRLFLFLRRRRRRGRGVSSDPSPPPPPRLLRWDEVPEDFVECFILSGYRRLHCSPRECLASALRPTNETLNFWTHFVPLLLLAGRLLMLLLGGFPEGGEGGEGEGGLPGGWRRHRGLLPFWCYASGVLLTLGMSCAAHLFSCLSPRLRAAFFCLDYASISYYGFASTLAYYHYLLPGLRLLEEPSEPAEAYLALVLPVALALALACTAACCRSRCPGRWAHPLAVRTLVFVLPLSVACPIALESLLRGELLRRRRPALARHFHRRYLWLALAAFFNLSKLPERLLPGRFDVVGHSHQLFHLCTSLSIREQLLYVEEGLLLRGFLRQGAPTEPSASSASASAPDDLPTVAGTLGYMLLLVLGLALVLRPFLREPPPPPPPPPQGGPTEDGREERGARPPPALGLLSKKED